MTTAEQRAQWLVGLRLVATGKVAVDVADLVEMAERLIEEGEAADVAKTKLTKMVRELGREIAAAEIERKDAERERDELQDKLDRLEPVIQSQATLVNAGDVAVGLLEAQLDEAVALLRYEGCCTCIGPLDNDESAQPPLCPRCILLKSAEAFKEKYSHDTD